MRLSHKAAFCIVTAWLAACSNTSEHSHHEGHHEGHNESHHAPGTADGDTALMSCSVSKTSSALGLMTSLPLNWELGKEIADFAQGNAQSPWQARALSSCYTIMPLDTLSQSDETAIDGPLDGLQHLAIIQPRPLTPSDNVALDAWVRAGGKALIVLDPLLTGHYELPLGDPRRPTDTFLLAIPPVVTRWGLEVEFDEPASIEAGRDDIELGESQITVEVGSRWKVIDPEAATCDSFGDGYGIQCAVGDGQVTLFGDAALFEHREMAGENFEAIAALTSFALSQ